MAAKNDVTGDSIKTRGNSVEYQKGWDAIFGKKDKKKEKGDGNERSKK